MCRGHQFFCVVVVSLAVVPGMARGQTKSEAKDAALERTRKQVLMLDDIYKTAVVLITDKYVQDEQSFPAGSAAIALFDAIKKKGHHEVRLLDATGAPYNDKNVAKDDFEKEAIKQLKQGKATYEKVESRNDGRYLRMATSVPVVMKKCIMCHEVYNKAKEGEPIGAL
jgi:hypothetical protein